MENNEKNKEKFYALYWDHRIQVFGKVKAPIDCTFINSHEPHYIELKPLSSITNEDAIGLAEILGCTKTETVEVTRDQSGNNKYSLVGIKFLRYQYLLSFALNNQGSCMNLYYERYGSEFFNCLPLEVWDFIRSKGYALPWLGLSVDKQIEYGWIKLLDK